MTKITKLLCLAQLKDTNPDLIVCENPPERECSNCKKKYTPTQNDVSTRRPSCYFKSCSRCREKNRNWQKNYFEREKEKKKNEKDGEIIQFSLPIYF
jgi:hypothetical protein